MTHSRRFYTILLFCMILCLIPAGCGKEQATTPPANADKDTDVAQPDDGKDETPAVSRDSISQYLLPEAPGTVQYGTDTISVDASNISEGYVMVRYSGSAEKVKLQVKTPDQTVYTYTILPGDFQSFPLSGGSGAYHLDILEHAYDNMYAHAFAQDLDVALNDEFKPFLYPNQYAWYTQDSAATQYAYTLSQKSSDDLDFVGQVYRYVTENITYDKALAENVPANYVPDIDRTMESGKGICFDYASLMTSMLRCQGIPVKLEVGYSGEAYHAWISVYLKETGWIDNIIQFNGSSWSLVDPTLGASNNSDSAISEYIGDGSNYIVKYSY